MSDARQVHVGYRAHKTLPNTYQVYAECADSETSLMLSNWPTSLEPFRGSDLESMALNEHFDRCEVCREYNIASATRVPSAN